MKIVFGIQGSSLCCVRFKYYLIKAILIAYYSVYNQLMMAQIEYEDEWNNQRGVILKH